MARTYPSDWTTLEASGAMARLMDTLRLLAHGLGARYSIYHGVHWTRVGEPLAVFEGIDFIVVSPAGRIALIEQKSGFLNETADGLVKLGAYGKQSVAIGLGRAAHSLRTRLGVLFAPQQIGIEALLYCPDYTVQRPAIAGVEPSRIVDARRKADLLPLLRALLPADEPVMEGLPKLQRFFADLLELAPQTAALRDQAGQWVTRLAQGLATWGMAFEVEPQRVRVIGTAGSGKTQLALRVLKRAVMEQRRALYVCFNRPLADHISRIAWPGAEVLTYHQLCEASVRQGGAVIDFSQPAVFAMLEQAFARELAEGRSPRAPADVLVVDEGQDFEAAWVAPLLSLVRPESAVWWLEDPLQNLYQRPPVELPGFAILRAQTNYRSPRDLVALLGRIVTPLSCCVAASPFQSSGLSVSVYADASQLAQETKRAITQALGAGFGRADIVVLSFHGRAHSQLAALASLGPHALRRFSGRYDLWGEPLYSEGEVLFESLYRFKGQSAPCIILTEIDFATLDERAQRKLFVGMTRASMKLFLIVSESAARALAPHLDDAPAGGVVAAATVEDALAEPGVTASQSSKFTP